MPRRARIMLAGVPVHVIQRGNNRGPCFVNDEDRNFYLFHLARGLGRFGCELHGYCLMTNHVHLLLTPEGAASCAALMKHMGQLHSQYFNKRYKRTGSIRCVPAWLFTLAIIRGRATATTHWVKRRPGLLPLTRNTLGSATAPKIARRSMPAYSAPSRTAGGSKK